MGPTTLHNQPESYNSSKIIGFKGLEALALVVVIGVLLMISALTSLTNLMIIYKLRLFPRSEMIAFSDDGHVIFNHEANLNRINLYKNVITGVSKIKGEISLEAGSESYLHLNSEGLEIGSPEGFKVYSKKTEKLLFPPDFSQLPLSSVSSLSIQGGIRNVHKIRSPTDSDLSISSDGSISVSGNEGVYVESKVINLSGSSISLSSVNGSVVFDGEQGININPSRMIISHGVPFGDASGGEMGDGDENGWKSLPTLQYKLCVCGKTGRLFRIKVKSPDQGCSDVRFPESSNPCT